MPRRNLQESRKWLQTAGETLGRNFFVEIGAHVTGERVYGVGWSGHHMLQRAVIEAQRQQLRSIDLGPCQQEEVAADGPPAQQVHICT